jgi:hypothetical protein
MLLIRLFLPYNKDTGKRFQDAQHARVGGVALLNTVPSPCVEAEEQQNIL